MAEEKLTSSKSITIDKRLDMFKLKPELRGVHKYLHESIPTTAPLPTSSVTPMDFPIPANSGQLLDLSHSVLCIEGLIKHVDGTVPVDDINSKIIPTNLMAYSCWEQVEVFLSNQQISIPQTTQKWICLLNSLLNVQDKVRSHQLKLAFWSMGDDKICPYLEASDSATEAELTALWLAIPEEIRDRANAVAGGKKFELIAPLFLWDSCNFEPYLPPVGDVLLRMHPADPKKFLMTRVKDKQFKFEITKAYIHNRRAIPEADAMNQISRTIAHTRAKYPLILRDLRGFNLTAGIQSFDQELFQGRLPRRVIIFGLKESQFVGGHRVNPFALQNLGMKTMQLYVNGASEPSHLLKFDWNNSLDLFRSYLYFLVSLGVDWNRDAIELEYDNWKNSYPIFVFEIRQSSDVAWSPPEDGHIRINANFEPLKESSKLMVLFEHERVLTVEQHGNPIII